MTKLLTICEVHLYGQVVTDMDYKPSKDKKSQTVAAEFKLGTNTKFARIFGFSYEGSYYGLDTPTIMLVDGNGETITDTTPKEVQDSFSSDMKMWTCDISDSAIRFDSLMGSIEDILLEVELGGGMDGHVSGGRVSGGRVSGGRVSGGRVSGGRVSGGKSD